MKRIIYPIMICMIILTFSSCKKFDNYTPPAETLTGRIIDATTGKPIELEPNGAQIRLEELSWGTKTGAAVQPQEFPVKPDGNFNNTKLFAGNYLVYPWNGPFVPYYSLDAGNPIDKRKNIDIKGVTTVEFTVDPLLKVEWVGEPVLNANNTVTVSFKFTRGTTDPFYIKDVANAWLFISETPFVGNSTFNPNLSNSIVYASGAVGNAALGTTVTLTSKLPLNTKRAYYLRVGARTNDNIGSRYNYNAVKPINVP